MVPHYGTLLKQGGGKMVFLVIVCTYSYIYTQKKKRVALYGGYPLNENEISKNGIRSNRDP